MKHDRLEVTMKHDRLEVTMKHDRLEVTLIIGMFSNVYQSILENYQALLINIYDNVRPILFSKIDLCYAPMTI